MKRKSIFNKNKVICEVLLYLKMTTPTNMFIDQSDLDNFSIQAFISDSSRMCQIKD